MSNLNDRDSRLGPSPEAKPPAAEELNFLAKLLDKLATEDRAAYDALRDANPDLVEHYGESDHIRQRTRAALLGHAGTTLSPEQQQLVERIKATMAKYRASASQAAPLRVSDEPPGILTSVTRRLSPERAIELYRKIAPMIVHQMLNRLKPSVNLSVVQRLVDHLCTRDVLVRLSACEHVRDGILDELCTALGRHEIRRELSRADLQRVLEESGAVDDLIAMENCIKIAVTRAS